MERIFMSTIPSQDHFEKLLLSESFIKIIFLCFMEHHERLYTSACGLNKAWWPNLTKFEFGDSWFKQPIMYIAWTKHCIRQSKLGILQYGPTPVSIGQQMQHSLSEKGVTSTNNGHFKQIKTMQWHWCPGGYSGFQVTGMIEGFFGGLKFSIPGFFWVRKFGLGSLIWVGIFWGY